MTAVNLDAAIRPIERSDISALKNVIDATDLFPSEMLDAMLTDYFRDGADRDDNKDETAESGGGFWLTVDVGGAKAVAYCAPEKMTTGTWNLYLIAVHPDFQGRGFGASLIRHIEQVLAARGERILLVETSGLPGFARTRAFYLKCGYEEEARVRDFYEAGEDKIVFRKALR